LFVNFDLWLPANVPVQVRSFKAEENNCVKVIYVSWV